MNSIESSIIKIREIVKTPGFIFALCLLITEDFRIPLEKSHKINYAERTSINEAALLIGFLIKKDIDYSKPSSIESLMRLKRDISELLLELHRSFTNDLQALIPMQQFKTNSDCERVELLKNMYSDSLINMEAIFYANDGAYDFQYTEFLKHKYKYDYDWLIEHKQFDIYHVGTLVSRLKDIYHVKLSTVHLYGLKEIDPVVKSKFKAQYKKDDFESEFDRVMQLFDMYQYRDLFYDEQNGKYDEDVFYTRLLNMFIISSTDISDFEYCSEFLTNFSTVPSQNTNVNFDTIGDYNVVYSNPFIRIGEDKFLFFLPFLLYQAVYETPFYWMMGDEEYRDSFCINRGKTGEEITQDLLLKIFPKYNVFRDVKIQYNKSNDISDIDILCIAGNKAICVQVKSKKLTLLSRKGSSKDLKNDFLKAVQESYEQGLVARKSILTRNVELYKNNGDKLILPKSIQDVYIVCVTTENYPGITYQVFWMLDKKVDAPYPLVISIFDLELISHYLARSYDFLYYVRQRTNLFASYHASDEISLLGYHLMQKICKSPSVTSYLIPSEFAQCVDRNYYPYKSGLNISDEGDILKGILERSELSDFCDEIMQSSQVHAIDIIFGLLDFSSKARTDIVQRIKSIKQQTHQDMKHHDIVFLPNENSDPRTGVSFYSHDTNNVNIVRSRLEELCKKRKYLNKGDIWIGFGCCLDSNKFTDVILYDNSKWVYESEKERTYSSMKHGQLLRLEKMGRNELCHCGSMIKYKKCCGRIKQDKYI